LLTLSPPASFSPSLCLSRRRSAAAGADRFGALADEEHAAPSAAERYRSKAEKYYAKYGLR
jgi:hypothetical protein